MNKERRGIGHKISRIVLFTLLLAGIAVAMLYPFDNRSLTVCFVSGNTEYRVYANNLSIAEENCKEIRFNEPVESVEIKNVRIYGSSKSLLLKELTLDELWRCIESVEQGEKVWGEESIIITGVNTIHFYMNDEYTKILQDISSSFLQERIIMAGFWLCLIATMLLLCSMLEERKKENNWNNHGPIFELKQFIKDIMKYRQYMVYAAKTDLKAEVADSYLNRLWWLLEPFLNMIVYVVVFGNIMGNSIENYATFVFSALLMWNLFNKIINYSVKLVRNNKDIVTKVYIPKFIILLSNMILNCIKLLFSMLVLVLMMLVFKVQVGWNIFWIIPAYGTLILFAFGVGMIFLHFGVYVDDLAYAVGILLNMLMFLSGVFYNVITTLPAPLSELMICLNPVAMLIDTMRNALLYNTVANLPLLGMWFWISVILCAVGVHIVYKNENSYVKVV